MDCPFWRPNTNIRRKTAINYAHGSGIKTALTAAQLVHKWSGRILTVLVLLRSKTSARSSLAGRPPTAVVNGGGKKSLNDFSADTRLVLQGTDHCYLDGFSQ